MLSALKTPLFLQRWLPAILSLVFMLSVAVMLTRSFSQWSLPVNENIVSTSSPAPATVSVAHAHLFGRYLASMANLPETPLPLTLQGTVLNPQHPHDAMALIKADGTTKLYVVGDALPGGATLNHVGRTRVVIKLNGQLQNVRLPVPKL